MTVLIRLLIFIGCFLVPGCSDKNTHSLAAYRNIKTPAVFAAELSLENNTYKGSFSDDFNTFYFFRKLSLEEETYVPYRSVFSNGSWGDPIVAEYYDENNSYTYQLKVPNSQELIFISDKRTKADTSTHANYNFGITSKSNEGYQPARELGPQRLLYNYNSQPCITKSRTIYFTSDSPDWSETISCKMEVVNDKYQEPMLFEPVNQWRKNKDWIVYEYCMAPDEDYMIICIQPKEEGKPLNTDLYISYLESNQWTAPEELAHNINTHETENFPTITHDGEFLIFTRAFSQFLIIPTQALTNRKPQH